jgi:hypothetical protein
MKKAGQRLSVIVLVTKLEINSKKISKFLKGFISFRIPLASGKISGTKNFGLHQCFV